MKFILLTWIGMNMYYVDTYSNVNECISKAELLFKNEGILNSDVGNRYRELILEKGGSEDPMKLIINFLEREPNSDAFYSSIGL